MIWVVAHSRFHPLVKRFSWWFLLKLGFACPWTNNDQKVNCTAGYYSLGNQRSCTRCPAGKQCPDVDSDTNIADCNAGYYRYWLPSDSSLPSPRVPSFANMIIMVVGVPYLPYRFLNSVNVGSMWAQSTAVWVKWAELVLAWVELTKVWAEYK